MSIEHQKRIELIKEQAMNKDVNDHMKKQFFYVKRQAENECETNNHLQRQMIEDARNFRERRIKTEIEEFYRFNSD